MLSQRFGVSLYYDRPISQVMDRDSLTVDWRLPLEAVARLATSRPAGKIYDHIVVTEEGRLSGIVSVQRLLETLALLNQKRTEELSRSNELLRYEVKERKKAVQALGRSREMLRRVIDSHPHSIFWKNHELVYLGCNAHFAREASLGDAEQVSGKTDRDLAWQNGEATLFREWDQRVLEEGKPVIFTFERVSSKNGQARIITATRMPLYSRQGTVIGILGTHEDITERVSAEKERERLEAQLKRAEKMEVIGTLAGGVAHDLNNILSGVVSYPELILMDLPPDSPLRRPILTVQSAGQRAAAVVQDLLTLARRGVSVQEIVDINGILRDYLKSPEFEKLALTSAHVEVETSLAEDLFRVEGSPLHLSKTLMNLITNAFEAMPKGGLLRIETFNQYVDRPVRGYDQVAEGEYVVVRIQDTGIGIPQEDISRIFEPFYTKKVMGRSGTGLGMAVVWGAVKDHNGYIDVDSRPGEGTTFTLYFPSTRKRQPRGEEVTPLEEFLGTGESVLVVDDVPEQREIAEAMIRKLAYSVRSVSSGEEACAMLKETPMDLLVLDMILDTGMDGLETYEKVLSIRPGQKAIIASGFSETERVRRALELGAARYVKKPYTIEKLGLAIREALGR
jgi:PAS domain S-box-containing protein